jgi:hypothetical protein
LTLLACSDVCRLDEPSKYHEDAKAPDIIVPMPTDDGATSAEVLYTSTALSALGVRFDAVAARDEVVLNLSGDLGGLGLHGGARRADDVGGRRCGGKVHLDVFAIGCTNKLRRPPKTHAVAAAGDAPRGRQAVGSRPQAAGSSAQHGALPVAGEEAEADDDEEEEEDDDDEDGARRSRRIQGLDPENASGGGNSQSSS